MTATILRKPYIHNPNDHYESRQWVPELETLEQHWERIRQSCEAYQRHEATRCPNDDHIDNAEAALHWVGQQYAATEDCEYDGDRCVIAWVTEGLTVAYDIEAKTWAVRRWDDIAKEIDEARRESIWR